MCQIRFKYLVSFLSILILLTSCNRKISSFSEIIESREGKNIKLRKNVYEVTKPFVLTENNIVIDGNNSTFIWDQSLQFSLFELNTLKNVELKNINIIGNNFNNSRDQKFLEVINNIPSIKVLNSNSIKFDKIKINKIISTGIYVIDSKNISIKNSSFNNIGLSTWTNYKYSYDGIFLGGYRKIENVVIDSCEFTNIGMEFEKGNEPWPNDGDGVQILSPGEAKDIYIKNCTFFKCSARGVKIQNGHNIHVNNSKFNKGWSAIMMPMADDIDSIFIKNNEIKNNDIPFATDGPSPFKTARHISIENNNVDSCIYFFCTNGYSNVENSNITKNNVKNIGRFFVSGRLFNTKISENNVFNAGYENDGNFNMIFLIATESHDLKIFNNIIVKSFKNLVDIENRSNNNISITNNKFSLLSN